MTTLEASDLAYYRDLIGDFDIDNLDLDDDAIQSAFDRASAFDLDTDTTEARTVVYLLRRMRGRLSKLHDARGEVETESFSQVRDHINADLKDWEAKAGMTGAVSGMTVGILNLGIDSTCEDEWDL